MSTPFAPAAQFDALLQKLDALAARDARAAMQRSQRLSLVGSMIVAAVGTAALTVIGLYWLGLLH